MIDRWLRVVTVTGRYVLYSLPALALVLIGGIFVDLPVWLYWAMSAPFWLWLTIVVVPVVVAAVLVTPLLAGGIVWAVLLTLIGPRKEKR